MNPGLRTHLEAMSAAQRGRMVDESRKALRLAWSARRTDMRAKAVIRANVTMLRNLRAV